MRRGKEGNNNNVSADTIQDPKEAPSSCSTSIRAYSVEGRPWYPLLFRKTLPPPALGNLVIPIIGKDVVVENYSTVKKPSTSTNTGKPSKQLAQVQKERDRLCQALKNSHHGTSAREDPHQGTKAHEPENNTSIVDR